MTSFDVEQTGVTAAMLAGGPEACEVMAARDARFGALPYRLVAHSAHTEATLIGGQREHCPVMAAIALVCTVRLARLVELGSHSLERVAGRLGLPIPANRHRALPDAALTAQEFVRLLIEGVRAGRWRTVLEVQAAAGLCVKPAADRSGASAQSGLF